MRSKQPVLWSKALRSGSPILRESLAWSIADPSYMRLYPSSIFDEPMNQVRSKMNATNTQVMPALKLLSNISVHNKVLQQLLATTVWKSLRKLMGHGIGTIRCLISFLEATDLALASTAWTCSAYQRECLTLESLFKFTQSIPPWMTNKKPELESQSMQHGVGRVSYWL